MASENPFPLNILPKVDSWEKEQLLMHIHPTLKLTADEINILFAALNYLNENITVSGYIGNVPATFHTVNIDFNDPVGTPITKVKDFINAMPNHVIPNGYAQWFRTYRAVLTNGQGIAAPAGGGSHFAIIAEYYLLTNKIPPVNGVVSIGTGGTQITTADLMKLYERDSRSAEPVEYDLGDIGTSEIWDAADGSGPRPTPNSVTTLFRAIQGGTEKIWLYIGGQEEVGTGYPVTDAGDYREISSDGSGMDPAPPSVFTFHEYADIAAMEADQSNQTAGDLILVKDAGADTNITFEVGETRKQAMYKRKGSAGTEDIADYLLVAVPYGNGGDTFDPTQLENDIQNLEDTKQDKEAGKGLSQENYTTAEKNKLAGLESSKWRGLYVSKSALVLANPTPEGGDYADVDAGVGADTIRYVYDESDDDWIESGSGSPLTGAQIKILYEGEPDTNAFDDARKSKLDSITAIFTTALKNAYDNVVTWISTNGQNVLDHVNSQHAPANAQKNSDITSNEITNSLGYIPENLERKVSNLLFPDDLDYPTTKAVADGLETKVQKVTTGSEARVYSVNELNGQEMVPMRELFLDNITEGALITTITSAIYTSNMASFPSNTIEKGRMHVDETTGILYIAYQKDKVIKK